MDSKPIPFDTDAPLGDHRAIIRRNPEDMQEIEMVEAVWGSNPRFNDGLTYRFVRSEGRDFPGHRCLIAASEFRMRKGEKDYRVTLDSGNHFYLAAIWEPAIGDWPLCYRIISVAANPEVARYQERHGAIIQRRDAQAWLMGTLLESELLVTPPKHTFIVQEISAKPAAQTSLAF